jgi:hypothetical protein
MRGSKVVLMLSTLVFVVAVTVVPVRADEYYISMQSCGCSAPMVLTHNHHGCAGGQDEDWADMDDACQDKCQIALGETRTVQCVDHTDGEIQWSSVSLKCPGNCPG